MSAAPRGLDAEGLRRLVSVKRVSKMDGRENAEDGSTRFRSDEDQDGINELTARRAGGRIVAEFGDYDVSGGTMDRPGLQAAIELIREGRADGIVVSKLDRFARDTVGAIETLDLIESLGGSLICGDLNVDTSDPMGRVMFTQAAAMAQFEKDRKGQELARAAAAATREGIAISPPPPGLRKRTDRRLEHDPKQAHLIRPLFEKRAAGLSWSMIRDWWADETGDIFKAARFSLMIRDRRYLGELHYGAASYDGVGEWKLIEPELFASAQGINAPRPRRAKQPHTALLAGIPHCASCGRPMTVTEGGSGRQRIYRCQKLGLIGTKCGRPASIRQEGLDAYVVEQFLAWAGDVEAVTTDEYAADFEAADRKVAAAERALDQFVEAFSGIATARTKKKAARLEALIDEAVAERDELQAQRKVAGLRFKAADLWDAAELDEKRGMLKAGIARIDVHPLDRLPTGGFPRLPVVERISPIVWRVD